MRYIPSTLPFHAKIMYTKNEEREFLKCIDPTLIPYIKVIGQELNEDEVLIVIDRKRLARVYDKWFAMQRAQREEEKRDTD